MKTRVFIGSSVEGLDIAYAIQQNLEYDAAVTVWTQGIFQLSSNSLDDLFNALENFDFGIFVFKPDDVTQLRNEKFNVVRDNVIFELGLFFGKLGKDRVFFLLPDSVENFHLPSDLLGVMGGRFNNNREDGNLHAALGSFCNQVRQRLKNFAYESMVDLADEGKEAKKIALEKKGFWEAKLAAALLRTRMNKIQSRLTDIQKGHVFKKTTQYSIKEFNKWFSLASDDMIRMLDISKDVYLIELEKAFGPPGVSGNIHDIKQFADKIATVCEEMLVWEIDLQTIKAPEELQEIPQLMRGWSRMIIDEFGRLPLVLEENFSEDNIAQSEAKGEAIAIELTFNEPPNIERIIQIIERVTQKVLNGELDYE